MSNCQCGSRKKDTAPSEFSPKNTGIFCSLIGIDSPICPLIDVIPSLIGSSWKSILEKVAKESLNIGFNQLTNKFDTASFCAVERPPLPPDITYEEVFLWLATYIPVVGGFADGDPLLVKVTQIYLYQKWLDYCECKDCNPLNPNNPIENNLITSSCPPAFNLEEANEFISRQNANNIGSEQSASSASLSVINQLIDDFIAESKRLRQAEGYYSSVESVEIEGEIEPPDSYYETSISFGCIDLLMRYRAYKRWIPRAVRLRGVDPSGEFVWLGGYSLYTAKAYHIQATPSLTRCNCFPDPQLPVLPVPSPPPPEFSDRYPESPFTSPPAPQNCEVESVSVSLFRECDLPKYSVNRELNKTGNDEQITVAIFDDCWTARIDAVRVLLKCENVSIYGCTDSSAVNYNPLATDDDGSCLFGCSVFEAEITAFGAYQAQNGIIYVGFNRPYAGGDLNTALNDLQNNQTFLDHQNTCENDFRQYFSNGWNAYFYPVVLGCTDPSAVNYNPLATEDDDTCNYPVVLGCTDSSAVNYNPLATENDGSCIYE